ncbi:MAG: hypothetical protein K6F45_09545 [Saccharofermentans sp.]|nr:hypothetical protein [Saccharofermentans sp.]
MTDVILTIVTLAAGCLVCFAGYKFFRLSLALVGAALGFAAGVLLVNYIASSGAQLPDIARIAVIGVFTIGFGIGAFALYMKALILVSTLACGYWFYTDYNGMLPEDLAGNKLVLAGVGLAAGALLGVLVYYAQKWSISLLTALLGARILSSVISPLLWSGFLSGSAVGSFEETVIGGNFTGDYVLTASLVTVALAGAGLAIQLKTSRK